MGAILDLLSENWFGGFSLKLTVHIIDLNWNLTNMFAGGKNGERFIIWDYGEAENMRERLG
jgi:cell division control protein 45